MMAGAGHFSSTHAQLRLCWLVVGAMLAGGLARGGEITEKSFVLEFSDGRLLRRSDFIQESASDSTFSGISRAPSLAIKVSNVTGAASFRRTVLKLTNTGHEDLPLARIVMLNKPAPPDARVVGAGPGAPIVFEGSFVGIEHPLAENRVTDGRLRCAFPLMAPLRPGEAVEVSLMEGKSPDPSQLRRVFQSYLEQRRPRAYAPFLHHNTWYNLGYSNPFSEADELDLIATLGRELTQKRGAKIDGFVLDDGWDDTRTLWRFNAGWPAGLGNTARAAAAYGAVPGIWISPWGGYNVPKSERLAAAAPEGFEIRNGGFSLAGPRYYERFRQICVDVIRSGGVGFFKFDGIGPTAGGSIDPAAGRDFDAMLRLIAELRSFRPNLYVSQTVGTWPSPWWLLYVDNIWRGGDDHGFAGVGSDREQWITFRDAQVYANIVRPNPLFPLNSVMVHGVILAQRADRLARTSGPDFEHEVRTFFGSGTQLQELYLSPELLAGKDWDVLADAARWSRRNTETLRDTHWVGGDPAKLQVYGWAAWSPAKGIVTLRNPSNHPAVFSAEVRALFELPQGVTGSFHITSPYDSSPAPLAELQVGTSHEISLRPLEVVVFEATPSR